MKVTVVSYSVSEDFPSLKSWETSFLQEVQEFIHNGSDVIVYPESFLLCLTQFFSGVRKQKLQAVGTYTKKELLPRLEQVLQGKGVLLCLGSTPMARDGGLRNTSCLWTGTGWVYQEKLHLTPWEIAFVPGQSVELFSFRGLKTCCLICFDIEQPGLAAKLKQEGVDFIIVPSATADRNGNQRVNRCASARSVELGACVVTSPLIGRSKCKLIFHSEGRQGFFLPAQSVVVTEQERYSAFSNDRKIVAHYHVDINLLKQLKKRDNETKPYFQPEGDDVKLVWHEA